MSIDSTPSAQSNITQTTWRARGSWRGYEGRSSSNPQREGKMRGLIGGLIAITGVAGFYALSFGMFVSGLAGPLAFLAAVLGLWSMLFGIPLWLLHLVT